MEMSLRIARLMVVVLGRLAAASTVISAQVSTGRIDTTIVDSTGAVLPGSSWRSAAAEATLPSTDTLGEAHFLNLAPVPYTVSAKLSGFSDYLNKSVTVGTGRACR
jgi:hypothetical protein